MNIRPPVETDFEQWCHLWRQYNEFYGRVGATALTDKIVQKTWERFFDKSEPVYCLVAEQGEQLVGLAHYLFHINTITIEPTCYLQDLFSLPNKRGKGIGRALLTEFYEQAKRAGTLSVYWHTHADNKEAMRLYDKMAQNTDFVVYRKSL